MLARPVSWVACTRFCDVRERISARYNSFGSTKRKPSKPADISITDVRTQKGPCPSLLCAFDRNGRESTRLRARFKMPKPPEQTSFPFFRPRTSSRHRRAFCQVRRAQRVFNWPLSPSRIYPTRKFIYALKLSADSFVTLPGSLRKVFHRFSEWSWRVSLQITIRVCKMPIIASNRIANVPASGGDLTYNAVLTPDNPGKASQEYECS